MSSTIRLPRILLTNDDGFEAPGLTLLAEIAQEFANEVWIFAPDRDRSGCSQSITISTPLYCTDHGERRWSVSGTSSDCVALALSHFMTKGKKPSLIMSGVNSGANIGDEVDLSGTVGAAMTGLMLGVPSIAISQACAKRRDTPWTTTKAVLPKVLRGVLTEGWRKGTCLSINIPNLPADEISGFSWSRQSHNNINSINAEKRTNHREQEYFWLSINRKQPVGAANSDSAILRRGEVAITPLAMDRSLGLQKPSIAFTDTDRIAADE